MYLVLGSKGRLRFNTESSVEMDLFLIDLSMK